MKIVQINTVAGGSTGKIMMRIAEAARRRGHTCVTLSTTPFSVTGRMKREKAAFHGFFGSRFENFLHFCLAQLTDGNGCYSYFSTLRLIARLKRERPDILHLHNLHGFCINLPLLFRFIKRRNIRVVWTLHDCWAFTGHCCHYDMVGCNAWQNGCNGTLCPQTNPRSRLFRAEKMWQKKKRWLSGVAHMQLVTPSVWLANQVRQSYLSPYPVQVIPNGIDLAVFRPTPSDFRKNYHLQRQKIVLAVAAAWSLRKGLDVVADLAQRLGNDYKTVVVGADAAVADRLPKQVICIPKTENPRQLAEIYTAADVFINPTREETYPTVNMEALACGTPVVTFRTGGSPEIIDNTCGRVVEKNDNDGMLSAVHALCEKADYTENCLKKACRFEQAASFEKYVDLYESFL